MQIQVIRNLNVIVVVVHKLPETRPGIFLSLPGFQINSGTFDRIDSYSFTIGQPGVPLPRATCFQFNTEKAAVVWENTFQACLIALQVYEEQLPG